MPCCAVLCVLQPPELHPYNFPELMIAPLSPLTEHDHQVGAANMPDGVEQVPFVFASSPVVRVSKRDVLRLVTFNW